MHLTSAGMPGPLYFSAKGSRVLDLSGIPPGLFADAQYETLTLKLEPGDSILFCSDGIIEAQNARYDDFGVTRLMNICNENSSVPPMELLARIFSAVHDFTDVIHQHDDMAALIFRLGSQETPKLPAKASVS
jgi:sigma-B regulation protein RsbU (phosphoserine phosphatase)